MPLLDNRSLGALRERQLQAAKDDQLCVQCSAQTWPNYCRECDEQFTDGHYATCAEHTKHQHHRRY